MKLSEAACRCGLVGEWNSECPRLGGALSSIVYKIDRKVIISVFEIVLGEFKRCAFTYDS